MKKQIILSVFTLVGFASAKAQAINPANRIKTAVTLTKQVKQNVSSKTEMQGQDMTQRVDNTTSFTYNISATNEQGATAEIKITAMKMDMEMMGREMSYDSQNPEDGSPEMGEQAKSLMKEAIKLTLDANGLITALKGNEKYLVAMSQSGASGLAKGEMLDVFFKVSKTVNPGDTWEDNVDTKESKIASKYTYKNFENGLATIEQISTLKLDQRIEQMGMTMYTKQEGTLVITYTVDPTTLIIKSKSSTTVTKGTIDAAGQTMPMSTFVQSTETIQ
ncbi:MAG: DUF6263 family protein [Chitinophagaceae bacterium]